MLIGYFHIHSHSLPAVSLKTAISKQVTWDVSDEETFQVVVSYSKEGNEETSCSFINIAMKLQRFTYLLNIICTLFYGIYNFFNIFCLPRVLGSLPFKFFHIPLQLADALGGVEQGFLRSCCFRLDLKVQCRSIRSGMKFQREI